MLNVPKSVSAKMRLSAERCRQLTGVCHVHFRVLPRLYNEL